MNARPSGSSQALTRLEAAPWRGPEKAPRPDKTAACKGARVDAAQGRAGLGQGKGHVGVEREFERFGLQRQLALFVVNYRGI